MVQSARRQGVAWRWAGEAHAGWKRGGRERGRRGPLCSHLPGLRFCTPAPMASMPLPVSSRPTLPLIRAPARQPLCRARCLDFAAWLRAPAADGRLCTHRGLPAPPDASSTSFISGHRPLLFKHDHTLGAGTRPCVSKPGPNDHCAMTAGLDD